MAIICTKCNQDLPKNKFGPDAKARSGKASWCKKCKNDYQKKYAAERRKDTEWRNKHNLSNRSTRVAWYGLTDNDYDEMLSIQNGVCAGCGMVPKATRRLDIDHEHQPQDKKREPWERASHVRGLLCHLCNRVLGILRDNPDTFKNLAKYLEQPPAHAVLIPKFLKIVDYLENPPAQKFLKELEEQKKLK